MNILKHQPLIRKLIIVEYFSLLSRVRAYIRWGKIKAQMGIWYGKNQWHTHTFNLTQLHQIILFMQQRQNVTKVQHGQVEKFQSPCSSPVTKSCGYKTIAMNKVITRSE